MESIQSESTRVLYKRRLLKKVENNRISEKDYKKPDENLNRSNLKQNA